MNDPGPRRRTLSEPRLAMLALAAIFVLVLCVVSLAETDDVWIIAVTVVAIVLIAAVIVIDIVRVIDRDTSGDDG